MSLRTHGAKSRTRISVSELYEEGEVVLASLDPAKGQEQGKTRHCLILEGRNPRLNLCIVLPITDASEKTNNKIFVKIKDFEAAGLSKASVIDCYQIRSIDRTRIRERKGRIDEVTLDKALSNVCMILGIEEKHLPK